MGFRLFVLPKNRSGQLSSMLWRARGPVASWANRPVGVPSCPAPPRRPAVRRPSPTRLWYVRVSDSTNFIYRTPNPEIPPAGRSEAAHGGVAGQGGVGRHVTPSGRFSQETTVLLPPREPWAIVLDDSSEERTNEILCKSRGEQNVRLTTG